MGEPKGGSVISELISALSSLQMPAEKLSKEEIPKREEDELIFMDEEYKWVKHAKAHIQSAIDVYIEEKGGIKNE